MVAILYAENLMPKKLGSRQQLAAIPAQDG
ncbi:hypothetical protein M271_00260 [Streptomyces rapamycinicus NRRL 5491]|uniref:Uncharacterized protein n=1 Tax=Streptomyces rapamycinicus TaxID=1226757 RepID=A0ABR6L9U5_9ACTN|nr:hypothetical protein M271_00260 [Streptomyces rapamycinicus NRRL 5491]MBB4779100.1 hypothetical protein [Streptomyces rapamycinicus]